MTGTTCTWGRNDEKENEGGDGGEGGDGSEGGDDTMGWTGSGDGYGDDNEELGGNDNERMNGERGCSVEQVATTVLARTKKRKATHDDEPPTATRATGKRRNTGGDQVATRTASSTKKSIAKEE